MAVSAPLLRVFQPPTSHLSVSKVRKYELLGGLPHCYVSLEFTAWTYQIPHCVFLVMGVGITYIYPVWKEFIVVDHLVDTVLLLLYQLRCIRVSLVKHCTCGTSGGLAVQVRGDSLYS